MEEDVAMISCEKEEEFKRGLQDKTRSLLFAACLLTEDERQEVRRLCPPGGNTYNGWFHLQLGVFLYDFFAESDGGQYTNLSSPLGREHVEDRLDREWQEVYGCEIGKKSGGDTDRLTSIKSKCWILKGGMGTSNVWRCLRDAVHSFQENDGNIEIRCDGKNAFMQLLLKEDSVERREYYRLVELLSDGARYDNADKWNSKVLPDEIEVWKMWVGACDRVLNLSRTAYVDWYLLLSEVNGKAEYVAGFDGFPEDEGTWREFEKTDGNAIRRRIPSSFYWAEPIPWNRNVIINYNGRKWNTLKSNDDDKERTEDESCLFHSVNEPLGVFVRYRSNKKDDRSCWWRRFDWNELPELSSGQSDFLVCGRDKESMMRLKLKCESDQVEWEILTENSFGISNPEDTYPQEKKHFPFRIYRITNRATDADIDIAICDNEREVRKLRVRGKLARMEVGIVGETEKPLFVSSMGRDSHCVSLSDEMELKVVFPHDNRNYKWMLGVNGKQMWTSDGTGVKLSLKDVSSLESVGRNTILKFALRCVETSADGASRVVGRSNGIFLPRDVVQCLYDKGQTPAGWHIEKTNVSESPIADRIAGFRLIQVSDSSGEVVEVGVPDQGFKWWFEKGHVSFWEMKDLPLLHDTSSTSEEFSSEDMRQKYLCLPPDVIPPESKWRDYFASGYFRIPFNKLIDGSEFYYDPEQDGKTFRFHGSDGNVYGLFKYKFEPTSVRLCHDKNDRLGVFVPRGDSSAYEVRAFSDQSRDLLFQGETLAQIDADNRFTDIQLVWDEFCQKVPGRDALLSVLKVNQTGGNTIVTVVDSTIKPEERLLLRNGGENIAYGDEELKIVFGLKAALQILRGRNDENHPVWRMRFFTTLQTESYSTVRASWRVSVDVLINGGCKDSQRWNYLFRKWLDSGFDPLIEGVAQEICQRIKGLFFRISLPPPFDTIDQGSEIWQEFVTKCLESNRRLDDREVRKILFAILNGRVTNKRISDFRTLINAQRDEWCKFECECIRPNLGKQTPDRTLLNQLREIVRGQQPNHDDDSLPGSILYWACLNNNVSEREMTFSSSSSFAHCSPRDVFDGLSIVEGESTSLVCKKVLGLLADSRKVGNYPNEKPTDREWLFCLAAATVLIHRDTGINADIRNILITILQRARNDATMWKTFARYQEICYSVQEIVNQFN